MDGSLDLINEDREKSNLTINQSGAVVSEAYQNKRRILATKCEYKMEPATLDLAVELEVGKVINVG